MARPPAVAPLTKRMRPTWAATWTGAAGVAVLLMLAAVGRLDVQAAVAGAAVVGAIAAWQTARAMRNHGFLVMALKGGAAVTDPEGNRPFAAVFEAWPEPALIISAAEADDLASRRVTAANPAARELLRVPREGSLLVNVIRRPEVLETVDETLFGGLTRTAAWEDTGAQERAWRAHSTPLPPAPGEPHRALLVIQEETDVKRAERTRADFMANASHELRTPLASLAGFIETLRGHAKDDPVARDRFLAIMADQADRMGRLVEDLLSLSRIELNEHIPPSGTVDVALATMDVCDALAPLAQEQSVTLERVLPERGEAPITGERDQILQVIQNLVANAVKYTPPGGRVVIEVAADLPIEQAPLAREPGAARLSLLTPDRSFGQRYVAVRVTDFGPGIEREHLPRLSERFYRVEGQKSGERAGTGLGLAIVKHIVNRHRGGFAVDSTPGQGSTFIVYLPMPGERGRRRQAAA